MSISRVDQHPKHILIHLRSGPELHIAHALAAAFEEPGWTQPLRALG